MSNLQPQAGPSGENPRVEHIELRERQRADEIGEIPPAPGIGELPPAPGIRGDLPPADGINDAQSVPANVELPKGKKCYMSQGWILANLIIISSLFHFLQPMWYYRQSNYVYREYNLTGVPNEISNDLSDHDVNGFVKVLHYMIVNEGCYEHLDPYNMAIDFFENRPVIPKDIIRDDLRRNLSYTYQKANDLIKLCENLFNTTYQDIVMPHGNDFIYMNDSLLKRCGYHIFKFNTDVVIYLVLTIAVFAYILMVKACCRGYVKNRTLREFFGIGDNPNAPLFFRWGRFRL